MSPYNGDLKKAMIYSESDTERELIATKSNLTALVAAMVHAGISVTIENSTVEINTPYYDVTDEEFVMFFHMQAGANRDVATVTEVNALLKRREREARKKTVQT